MNACYTYFFIEGDFDPAEITEILEITPEKTYKKGDLRKNGEKREASGWEACFCREYDVYTARQMEKTIAPLRDKVGLLNEIRVRYNARLYLAAVPCIDADGVHPALAPSLAVMDFCYLTRTLLDIDLYIN